MKEKELGKVHFDDVLKALRATISNKGGWTGPEIEEMPSTPSPAWNLSKEGLAYHKERGRNLMDVVIMVAFHCGYHNGTFEYKPFYEQALRRAEIDALRDNMAELKADPEAVETLRKIWLEAGEKVEAEYKNSK